MKRFTLLFFLFLVLYGCGNYNPVSLIQFATNMPKSEENHSSDSDPGGGVAGSPPLPAEPPPPPPPVVLQSITIIPASASIPKGSVQSYSAQGSYSNGTTQDLTYSVEWKIEAPAAVGHFSQNAAVGDMEGAATIRATLDGITVTAFLEVRGPEPVNLSVAPFGHQRLGVGSVQDFVPYGWFTDGTFGNPAPIRCDLSDTAVAMIIEVGENHCRVQGFSTGTAILSLSSYDVSSEVTIDVLPMVSLGVYPAQFPSYVKIGMDETGAPLIVFRAPFEGVSELFWSRRGEDGRWSPQARIGARPAGGWDFFVMDLAPDGSLLLVGTGPEGIYSVRYLPEPGWQGLEVISTKPLSYAESERSLQVVYGSGGIGVAAWTDGRYTYSSTYQAGSGWSAPAIRGSSISDFFSLTMNESGKAILTWHQLSGTIEPPGYTYTPYASIYTAGSGWATPIVLGTVESGAYPIAQINSSGEAIAIWAQQFPPYNLVMARLREDGSWTPPELFTEPHCGPAALDPQGNILVICGQGEWYRYLTGSGWQGPTVVEDISFGFVQLKADRDGNVLAVWSNGWKWFNHLSGWQPAVWIEIPRSSFFTSAFGMNSAGDAAIVLVTPFQLWNPDTKAFDPYYELFIQSIPSE
jgi:hypothetical protein